MEEINHNGLMWKDVCLRIPVVKKPTCFDSSKFSLIDYFFRKRSKKSVDEEDYNFDDFSLSFDEDKPRGSGEEETEEFDEIDEECRDVAMPDLSSLSYAELAGLQQRMQEEGFTQQLAEDISREESVINSSSSQ